MMWEMDGMHDGWGWWMVFGWVWMVVFWGLVVALVVWAVNRLGGHTAARREPLEIAKERLAKGEIDPEEFQRLKRELS